MASDLGYCGLDRQRRPLHGDEMRACWAGSIKPLLAETRPIAVMSVPPERPALAFVPVDSLVTAGHLVESAGSGTPDDPPVSDPVERPMSLGWTLWGDAYL